MYLLLYFMTIFSNVIRSSSASSLLVKLRKKWRLLGAIKSVNNSLVGCLALCIIYFLIKCLFNFISYLYEFYLFKF
jgi:hypothetical protein